MIQGFLTTLLWNTIGILIFIIWILSIIFLCIQRKFNKKEYSKKEFILDLIIPFRYFYKAFYNLFKD